MNGNVLASGELDGTAYTQTKQEGVTFYTNNDGSGYFDYARITG